MALPEFSAMSNEQIKIRLALFWVMYEVSMIAHAVLWTWQPNFIPSLLNGELYREHLLFIPMPANGYDPGLMLAVAVVLLVIGPLGMAWASFDLPDRIVRKINLWIGGLVMIFNFYHLTPSCSAWVHGKISAGFQIVITGAILMCARRIKL
jgi:hypothetical protein